MFERGERTSINSAVQAHTFTHVMCSLNWLSVAFAGLCNMLSVLWIQTLLDLSDNSRTVPNFITPPLIFRIIPFCYSLIILSFSGVQSVFCLVYYLTPRRMRWAGHVARLGEGRGVHRVSVGKPEGMRPLGRPRRRWEDNIKIDLEEVWTGWSGLSIETGGGHL
jgi:hypothetical protein